MNQKHCAVKQTHNTTGTAIRLAARRLAAVSTRAGIRQQSIIRSQPEDVDIRKRRDWLQPACPVNPIEVEWHVPFAVQVVMHDDVADVPQQQRLPGKIVRVAQPISRA